MRISPSFQSQLSSSLTEPDSTHIDDIDLSQIYERSGSLLTNQFMVNSPYSQSTISTDEKKRNHPSKSRFMLNNHTLSEHGDLSSDKLLRVSPSKSLHQSPVISRLNGQLDGLCDAMEDMRDDSNSTFTLNMINMNSATSIPVLDSSHQLNESGVDSHFISQHPMSQQEIDKSIYRNPYLAMSTTITGTPPLPSPTFAISYSNPIASRSGDNSPIVSDSRLLSLSNAHVRQLEKNDHSLVSNHRSNPNTTLKELVAMGRAISDESSPSALKVMPAGHSESEWVLHFSKRYQRPFWKHKITKEICWKNPNGNEVLEDWYTVT
jgi:hypothetical protein